MLAPGECRVWWVDPQQVGEAFVALLDTAERERLARLRRHADQLRFAAAHGLVRLVVGAQLGCAPPEVEIVAHCARCGGSHGKPQVRGAAQRVAFSLAHAGSRAVVAVTDGTPVGVDVEEVARGFVADEPLVRRALGAREAAIVAQLPAAQHASAFLRYWTRKEAILKATGDGLAVAPATLEVSGPHESPRLRAWNAPGMRPEAVGLRDLDLGPDYCAALAMLGPALRVVVRRYPAEGLILAERAVDFGAIDGGREEQQRERDEHGAQSA